MKHPSRIHNRRGAVIPMVALFIPVLLILSVMAINMAYIQRANTELEISTDAAGRAASRVLTTTRDIDQARAAAEEAGRLNLVAGKPVLFGESDIVFGKSDRSASANRYEFLPGATPINAVRVFGRFAEDSPNGRFATILPSVIGTNDLTISAETIAASIEVDMALVLDRSGSMAYSTDEVADPYRYPASAPAGWTFPGEVPPDARWLDLLEGVDYFLDQVQVYVGKQPLSLTTYSDDARVEHFLTTDYPALRATLDPITQNFEAGKTNIGAGLAEGADTLLEVNGARPFSQKLIILMTDGKRTMGGNPADVAKTLSKNGLVVFTITFSDEADIPLMKDVADEGGGLHFHARTREDLLEVFEAIAKELPTLIVN